MFKGNGGLQAAEQPISDFINTAGTDKTQVEDDFDLMEFKLFTLTAFSFSLLFFTFWILDPNKNAKIHEVS